MDLILPLKKKWFYMIASGEKLEEYREMSKYWESRLRRSIKGLGLWQGFKKFDNVIFTLGYPKATDTKRRLKFPFKAIKVGRGLAKWGANPEKEYFIITWEKN